MSSMKILPALLASLLALSIPRAAVAQTPSRETSIIPNLVNYQGRLSLATGGAPPNGTYTIEVKIFDQPSGGNSVWAQRFSNVQVVEGQFNIVLGNGESVPNLVFPSNLSKEVFSQPVRYLETRFGGGPSGLPMQTLQPRQQFTTAVY